MQAASILAVTPSQKSHLHSVPSLLVCTTARTQQGGHSFVAAQQPLVPGLEPSAHVAAEERPAAKTSTRSVASKRGDMLRVCSTRAQGPQVRHHLPVQSQTDIMRIPSGGAGDERNACDIASLDALPRKIQVCQIYQITKCQK